MATARKATTKPPAKPAPRANITPLKEPRPVDATTDAHSPGGAVERPAPETDGRPRWREMRWGGYLHYICLYCNFQTHDLVAISEHIASKHPKEER